MVKGFCSDGNGSPEEILSVFLADENRKTSLNSFRQIKGVRDGRQRPTTNTRCAREKDKPALRLLADD
jgi:hypothetical protein